MDVAHRRYFWPLWVGVNTESKEERRGVPSSQESESCPPPIVAPRYPQCVASKSALTTMFICTCGQWSMVNGQSVRGKQVNTLHTLHSSLSESPHPHQMSPSIPFTSSAPSTPSTAASPSELILSLDLSHLESTSHPDPRHSDPHHPLPIATHCFHQGTAHTH